MSKGCLIALGVLLATGQAQADGPVTGKEAPSPGPAQLRLWLEAMVQAPVVEFFGPKLPRSEALRMLLTVQRGEALGPGRGWYDPSRHALDWKWLAARFDADRDGFITRAEFKGAATFFHVLDRDRDGVISREDLDWSQNSAWVRSDALSLRFFRAIDANGNGRISEKEWLAMFKKLAQDRDHFNAEDLRDAFVASDRRGGAKGKRAFKENWLRCLVEGDLGSPFEGPRPGQTAPDFTLPTPDGKKPITLSDYRGKKPVVLIFGSFT
jgi:Ca2+-binding EF-hand superfamily protein